MANSSAGRAAGSDTGARLFEPLLNEHEAAHALNVEVTTLRKWRWAGKPPEFLKIGSAVRYEPATLAALVETSRRTSTSDDGRGKA